jgi:hypothetical protein
VIKNIPRYFKISYKNTMMLIYYKISTSSDDENYLNNGLDSNDPDFYDIFTRFPSSIKLFSKIEFVDEKQTLSYTDIINKLVSLTSMFTENDVNVTNEDVMQAIMIYSYLASLMECDEKIHILCD